MQRKTKGRTDNQRQQDHTIYNLLYVYCEKQIICFARIRYPRNEEMDFIIYFWEKKKQKRLS